MTQSDCQAAHRTAMRPAAGRAERGFNLIELMVTMTILAVIVATGLPEFNKFVKDIRLGGMASDLRADIQFARSESIRRNARVLVCPRANATANTCATTVTATTWANGWLVCYDVNADGACDTAPTDGSDPNPTRRHAAIVTPLALSGPVATLIFFPTGSANSSMTFTMTGGTTTTRTLVVAPSGSLTSAKT